MRALWLLLPVAACAPSVEGARCVTDDNCPLAQSCTRACVCRRSGLEEGVCGGYQASSTIALTECAQRLHLQISSDAGVVAMWIPAPSGLSDPDVIWYQREATSWLELSRRLVVRDLSDAPMGLSPAGSTIALRDSSGVVLYDVGLNATGFTSVWFDPARAVAHARGTVVASFASLGVRQKTVGQSASLDGLLLDAESADELELSNDASVVAARFFTNVRVFGGTFASASFTGVRSFDLAASGAAMALATTDGVKVASSTGLATVSTKSAREGAIDGPGTTLVALFDDQTAVFQLKGGAWGEVGEVDLQGSLSSGVTLSDDGAVLVIGAPSYSKVNVFTRIE